MNRVLSFQPSLPVYSNMMDSPIGRLTLIVSLAGLCRILLPIKEGDTVCDNATQMPLGMKDFFEESKQQLLDYFANKRKHFELSYDLIGTKLQKKVWSTLLSIPYGKTISYGELAKRLGSPQKARAVGRACSQNPLPILLPCHRVIGSSGKLVGFGGGINLKKYLIDLECHEKSLIALSS